jgi:hypothetical protein
MKNNFFHSRPICPFVCARKLSDSAVLARQAAPMLCLLGQKHISHIRVCIMHSFPQKCTPLPSADLKQRLRRTSLAHLSRQSTINPSPSIMQIVPFCSFLDATTFACQVAEQKKKKSDTNALDCRISGGRR